MHSTFVRAQNVFGYFTSVAFAVGAAIALSIFLSPQTPQAELTLKNVRVARGRPHYYSVKREEYAHVTFDLDADLSTLFNWNTKQIFLYITATYPSSSPSTIPPSEAVIWDAIIPSSASPFHPNTYIHPSSSSSSSSKPKSKSKSKKSRGLPYPAGAQPGILRLKSQKPKYQITDATGKMASRANATLTLRWNVQPWVGMLTWTNRESYGNWKGLRGGRSEAFEFPAIASGGDGGVKKEDLRTATGAERNRGSPA